MIKTPDILPNNLRVIREMKDKTTDETAQALGLNRSYISVLENNKANMSGKTAIAIMQYFDVNFYQLFDMEKDMELDYTIKKLTDNILYLTVPKDKVEVLKIKDINLMEALEFIKEGLLKKGIDEDIHEFEYIKQSDSEIEGMVTVTMKVTTSRDKVLTETFNIDFANEIDSNLFEALVHRRFKETKEIILKRNDFSIEDGLIVLNKHYDIVKNNIIENTNTIDLKSGLCKVNVDKNDEIVTISFNAQVENLYNIKFIENYLNLKQDVTESELGISNNGYINIVNGNQKISTKIMWKLVKLFKVPLEYIVNINLYSEKFL